MRQIRIPMNLYRTPCSPAYWHEANLAMKCLKLLVFAALMIAVTRALSLIPGIPIWHTKLTWGFLARSVCALVCGPVLGLVFGFVEDILGFILQPTGDFFPGYTLTAMAGSFVYALFLYRARITVRRIVLCKLCVNLLVNVGLNCLWSAMLYSKGYLFYLGQSLAKNLLMLPVEVVILLTFLRIMLPVLSSAGLTPPQPTKHIPF